MHEQKIMRVFVLALVLFFPFSAQAQRNFDVTSYRYFEGRDYILDIPSRRSQARRPLILVLHGAFGNARVIRRRLNYNMRPLIERHGFMVAYLNGNPIRLMPRGGTWNAGRCCGRSSRQDLDDVGYISRFIKRAVRRFGADPKRVFIIGHSNGAMMAYRFACEHPNKVTAIAAVAGTMMTRRCKPRGVRGVIHIHGMEDDRVPIEGGPSRRGFVRRQSFTSVAKTRRFMTRNGVPFQFKPLEGVGHSLADIDDMINLPKTVWRYFRKKHH